METWNREELYQQVWGEPVTKVAAKYGVSDVMIAKICRKLSIPVPGRGYWARKSAGQRPKMTPLPKVKEVPAIHRYQEVSEDARSKESKPPEPEPTDDLYLQIRAIESKPLTLADINIRHKTVVSTEKRLLASRTARSGLLEPSAHSAPCLDLIVSPNALSRALDCMNAIIVTLETLGFKVLVEPGLHGTSTVVFGHAIRFGMVEKLEVIGRHEEDNGIWKQKVIDYRPTGILELRVNDFTYGTKLRDRKRAKLEERLPECVGALLREGRKEVIAAEQKRLREIAERKRQEERLKLSEQIRKEEERLKELEGWVAGWLHAKEIRDFVSALESRWADQGEDTSEGSAKGARLQWMRQQADRIDPLVDSPPSVLDRKRELGGYW